MSSSNNEEWVELQINFCPEKIDVSEQDLFHRALIPLNGKDKLLVESQKKVCEKLKNMVEFKFEGKIFAIKAMEIHKKIYSYDVENLEFFKQKNNINGNEIEIPYIKFLDKKDGKDKFFVTIYHYLSYNSIKNNVPILTKSCFYFLNDLYIPIFDKETNKIKKLYVRSSKKFTWNIKEKLYDNIEKIEIYENKIVLNGQNELENIFKENTLYPFYEMRPFDYSGVLHGFIFDNYLFKFDSMKTDTINIMLGSHRLEPVGNISVYNVEFKYLDTKKIRNWEMAENDETNEILRTNNISMDEYKIFFNNLPEKSFEYYIQAEEEQRKLDEEYEQIKNEFSNEKTADFIFTIKNIMKSAGIDFNKKDNSEESQCEELKCEKSNCDELKCEKSNCDESNCEELNCDE
jgi:hypothetical protein